MKSTFPRLPGFMVMAMAAAALTGAAVSGAEPASFTNGNIRVQFLSDTLVRLEAKGPAGFEDRVTFHVINRDWSGTAFSVQTNADRVEIRTENYQVREPLNAQSLDGVSVVGANGTRLYQYDGRLDNSGWLPSPADQPQAWEFADAPRMVPPAWGLTPPPGGNDSANGGWDLGHSAPDVYVFLPHGDYRQLRKDFLKLTGPTEMMPLFAFGAFDSRWYDYSEATALKQVDDYRARKIPLDVLVVDTGWRRGASTGYQPNTNLLPNLPRFFSEAHAKNVKVLFNDHPEPVQAKVSGLNAEELNYRFTGLAGVLNAGLDVWWYDRNWSVALVSPVPNLRKEVWGMRLYHDTTARVRPEQRPFIMANVDGIDNGIRRRPMNVAAHRFSFQWTGDIGPGWEFLRRGVENAVHAGVQSAYPYMSDDLGGHTSNPTTEQFIRWIEYGAFSPVYRPHCTHNLERMPWAFGPEAETVARNLVNMRYRLLPVFYAAAHENYVTGEPLLRRLDLDFPQLAEAGRDDEYLLGQNILVAPVLQSARRTVPGEWLKTFAGSPGLAAEYFTNENLSGPAALQRTDAAIDFKWNRTSPAPNIPRMYFSARWSGTVEVPASVGDIRLVTTEDDGVRVWIDGRPVIEAWGPQDSTTTVATGLLTAGTPHQIRIEYQQLDANAIIQLQWESAKTQRVDRGLWIPPGSWINVWNGEMVSGPVMVTNSVPLDQIPVFVKSGAVLPLAPEMQFTSEKPWSPVMLDLYPRAGETNTASLYEDDTLTTAYQRGEFRTTPIAVSADEHSQALRVSLGAAEGKYAGALSERSWTLRIHPPAGLAKNSAPVEIKLNGEKINAPIQRLARAENAMPFGTPAGAPDADVFEISLPSAPVANRQTVEISLAP